MTSASPETLILMLVILAIFIYQGWRTGFAAQIVLSLLILIGFAIMQPSMMGDVVVAIINNIASLFSALFNGGIQALIAGNSAAFNASMAAAKASGPFISPASEGIVLFILMIIVIIFGFSFSRRTKRRAPFLGAVLGFVNGLLLSIIFLPLLPNNLPAFTISENATLFDLIGSVAGFFLQTLISVVLLPFRVLYDALGTWFIVLMIAAIVIIAARSLRQPKA